MSHPLDIIIVERLGTLKSLSIKDFKLEDLYKKCGFKKADDFNKQTEWNIKYDGKKYFIQVFAKTDGRANSENKYDFPPPIDTKLFYGSCAIIAQVRNDDGNKIYTNLSISLWDKIYEKLFGGFEDLAATAKQDEEEEDELANVPKEKKTKQGYLKDGFVVDSSDTEEDIPSEVVSDDDNEDDDMDDEETEEAEDEIIVEDVGSELSEESYDYDDKDVGK
jgi:lipopolysaccharide export LptBFGC system permease protein LptF